MRQKPQRFDSEQFLPKAGPLEKESLCSKRDEIRDKLNKLMQEKATLKSIRDESVEKLQFLKQV